MNTLFYLGYQASSERAAIEKEGTCLMLDLEQLDGWNCDLERLAGEGADEQIIRRA